MSTFSLNASGFLGDAEKVEEFFGKLKSLLSTPEYGVTNTQFTALGKWENDFHKPSDASPDPASDAAPSTSEGAGAQGAAATDSGSPSDDAPSGGNSGKKAVLS